MFFLNKTLVKGKIYPLLPIVNKKLVARSFSHSQVVKMDANFMSKINALLAKNKTLSEVSENEILDKQGERLASERKSLNERLLKEHEKSQSFLGESLSSATKNDFDLLEAKRSVTEGVAQQYRDKLNSLDHNDPEYIKKSLVLKHLITKLVDKNTDDSMQHLEACVEKDHLKTVGPEGVIWLKRAFTKRCDERNKILQEDEKLYLKEKEFMGKLASKLAEELAEETGNSSTIAEGSDNKLEKRSLIDDFADPNLEQPSYMDPED